ncbi:MAG: hypothetical protein HQM09_09450 [Candidatus Riflebacteria bacterium]|nr:hypothetical protein [Candidatus Riflebacteria bacterium]
MLRRLFIVFLVLITCITGSGKVLHAAQAAARVFPIYDSWSGFNSRYAGIPPCFIVKSLAEFDTFWQAHGVNEMMPNVNFGKTMLFVWCPGPGRFDYRPMKIERFFRDASGQLVILMGLDRQKSGGNMRNSYLIALLPRLPGNIAVMRVGDKLSGEADCMPLYTLWDMSGEAPKNAPVTVLKVPPKPKKPVNVAVAGGAPAEKPASGTAVAATAGAGKSGGAHAKGAGTPSTASGTASSGDANTASCEADPFKDAFNLDL